MKLEKDKDGVIRVAKGDKSGLGGQYANKPVNAFQKPVQPVLEANLDSTTSWDDYDRYEVFTGNKTAYVAFGAHQPFTVAHENIAYFGMGLAREISADFIQFTTAAYGTSKRHVLPLEVKVQLIRESLGVAPYVVKGPFEMFETLKLEGYSDVFILLGSDRSEAAVFNKAAEEYGVSLTVVPIARPANSVSGTMVREFIVNNNVDGFMATVAQKASTAVKHKVFASMSSNLT